MVVREVPSPLRLCVPMDSGASTLRLLTFRQLFLDTISALSPLRSFAGHTSAFCLHSPPVGDGWRVAADQEGPFGSMLRPSLDFVDLRAKYSEPPSGTL
jgi:hypothetical protein